MAKPYGRLYQKGKNVSIMGIDTYDVWPIGSVYISTNSTNPSVYFGGTWVQTCKSRCLMGAGVNEANTDNGWGTFAASSYNFGAGARIGEHHHTLNTDELPSHYHWGIYGANGASKRMAGWGETTTHTGTLYEHGANAWEDLQTGYAGGGREHNNMPPGEVVYIWKRTA